MRGLLDTVGAMYGIRFAPVAGAPGLWHPSVRPYDLWDGTSYLGRVYLDLFTRPDKTRSAGCHTLQRGVRGVHAPVAVLRANLPAEVPGQPSYLRWDDVRTLAHELGHLLHRVLGGVGARYAGLSGLAAELDFLEVPSQLQEGLRWSPAVLSRFALNDRGEPLPADILQRLLAAEQLGRGMQLASQLHLSLFALRVHGAGADTVDPEALLRDLHPIFMPYPYHETHVAVRFLHLSTYSSNYYTYAWSLAMARALEPEFERVAWTGGGVGRRFRARVLEPGASLGAATLVRDFLGRELRPEALAESVLR